jgi:hypothetical protein
MPGESGYVDDRDSLKRFARNISLDSQKKEKGKKAIAQGGAVTSSGRVRGAHVGRARNAFC